ncbi:MAG: zinc-binding dehydrogenase [Myxococcota bacterium]
MGDGKLGQLVTQALLAGTQGSITLVGRHPAKLALAAQRGAHTLLATHAVPGAQRFDIVVEATGTQEGLAEALAWVEPMGTVVLKSTFHGLASVDVSQVVVSEVTLVGSRCGPFAPAIEALSSGAIDPEPLIADVFDLAEGQAAFERASQRGVLKVLMAPREWS